MDRKKIISLINSIVGNAEDIKALVSEEAEENKEAKGAKTEHKKASGTKKADKEEDSEGEYTEEGLNDMSYNELKALAKKLGIPAVGKKPELIEAILGGAGDSDADSEEDILDDEGEDEDLTEQIKDLDLDELKEIAKEAKVTVKKGMGKDKIIEALGLVPDKLEKALEALGYFDDEKDTGDEGEPDDEEDNDTSLVDKLTDMDVEDLAEILDNAGLSKKGKKQALVDRIIEAYEDGKITDEDLGLDEDEDEDEDEDDKKEEDTEDDDWYTEEELKDMSDDELKDLAKENELEIPLKKKGKKKVLDREALITAIIESGDEDDSEGNSDEDFEVSEEREKAEADLDKSLRAKIKSGKIKDTQMKKQIEKYYEGDPDCKDCKGCSKEERIDCFVEMMTNFIDDDGEVHKAEDPYTRNGVDFCCGKELVEQDGKLICEVCGAEYDIEEE